jgi:hypothetical protein
MVVIPIVVVLLMLGIVIFVLREISKIVCETMILNYKMLKEGTQIVEEKKINENHTCEKNKKQNKPISTIRIEIYHSV